MMGDRTRNRFFLSRQDWLAAGFLTAVWAIFFHEPLFTRMVKLQWDILDILYPHLLFTSRSLHADRIPFWNPYLYCGYPFIGDIQAGTWFPVNFLAALIREITPRLLLLVSAIHSLAALLGMYFLSRVLRMSAPGSVIAAMAFVFSGQFLGHMTHLWIIQTMSVWPWILGMTVLGIRNKNRFLLIVSGGCFGMAVLAGHFQTDMYAGTFLLAWIIFERISGNTRQSILSGLRGLPFDCLLVFIPAFLMMSVQLFSTAELALHSSRSGISYQLASSEELKPASLVTAFIPDAFGGLRGPYHGPWDRVNQQCYAGTLTLMLAGLGWLKRDRYRYFLTGLFMFGFLFSLGEKALVHPLALRLIPGWDLVRTPSAMMIFVYFCLALMAGFGMDVLGNRPGPVRRTGILLVLLLIPLNLIAFYAARRFQIGLNPEGMPGLIRQWLISSGFQAAFSLVLVFECFRPCRVLIALLPVLMFADFERVYWKSDLMFGRGDPYEDLVEKPVNRFLSNAYREEPLFRIQEWEIREVLLTNEGSLRHYLTTQGRVSGLHPRYIGELLRMSGFHRGLLDLMSVRYVLSSDKPSMASVTSTARIKDGWRPWDPKKVLARAADQVYENEQAFPRLFAVGDQVVSTSAEDSLELMMSTDLTKTAVVQSTGNLPEGMPGRWEYAIREYSPHEIRFDYALSQPALVVLTDTYYPGWTLSVGGREVDIFRADHAFRGMVLPEGEHSARMKFEPRFFRYGLFLTLLGGSILVFAVIMLCPYRSSAHPQR